ncbi:RecF/RecN/SMC [Schizophyllum commune]
MEAQDDEEVDNGPPPAQQPASAASQAETSAKGTAAAAQQENASDDEEEGPLDATPPPQTQPASQPAASQAPKEERKGPRARLVIHKLTLVNFKSYAGKQVIGPFHKSFSAIVGPNGSGKSNTIDALLFVFGYRATKMRQAKLSELIHNSARHPDLDECSVEVHFQDIIDEPGDEKFEVVPGSDLRVARHANRQNASRYTINERLSNYTEVQKLLKGRGIDLDHKRFLILQGEVESIAQMKPKATNEHEEGLLEYLEDIIGTSQYVEQIEKAQAEMEQLTEEKAEMMTKLRRVEKEKDGLSKEKEEADSYLRLCNERTQARSAKVEAKLASEKEKNKDDIEHFEQLQAHYNDKEAAFKELKAAVDTATKELAENEKEQVTLQERYKGVDKKMKKLKKDVQEATKQRNNAQNTIEESTEKREKNQAELEMQEQRMTDEHARLMEMQTKLSGKTQKFTVEIEKRQKELAPWTEKINDKQAEINVATSERDALMKKAQDHEEALHAAEEHLKELRSDQKVKADGLNETKAKRASVDDDIREASMRVEAARAAVEDCRRKASAARQRLEEVRASQAESKSQGNVVDALNRIQAEGRISGFHGKLGTLGTIPDKYDVAITTACPGLQNLVVDDLNNGQLCTDYMRRNNVGRATFLILEKLKSNIPERSPTPENVPRLFDLVKPKDPRFRPAFWSVIRETLVAENLEQANRIAYGSEKRYKVVTLAGQLIEPSGVMSGGGSRPQSGGMSSKLTNTVSPQQVRDLDNQHQKAQEKLRLATDELEAAEQELDRLKRSAPELSVTCDKLEMDLQNSKKLIQEAEKRVSDLKAASQRPNTSDKARIASLEATITSATRALEKLEAEAGKIQSVINDLEQKILDVGGSELRAQKSKIDGIKEFIKIATDAITKAEVDKAKAERDLVKYGEVIDKAGEEQAQLQADADELQKALSEMEEYVDSVRDRLNQVRQKAEKEEDILGQLKTEVDEQEEKVQSFRKKEAQLKRKLEELAQTKRENEAKTEQDEDDEDEDEDEEGEDGQAMDVDGETGGASAAPSEAGDPAIKSEPGRKSTPDYKVDARGMRVWHEDELQRLNKNELIADYEVLDERIKAARPNLTVLEEYKKVKRKFMERLEEYNDVYARRDAKKAEFDDLRKRRLTEFATGFNQISLKLKEMYQLITIGGNAELEYHDSLDPFSEGIDFSVMPPKKSWKNIGNLSGGEKTLSSLALVFALHVYKPTPLYFMDEIDAALDFRNVSIIANYIKDRTENAQFIIISLRNDMFELSNRLIGIYKTSNETHSIAVDNDALMARAQAARDAAAASASPRKAGASPAKGTPRRPIASSAVNSPRSPAVRAR